MVIFCFLKTMNVYLCSFVVLFELQESKGLGNAECINVLKNSIRSVKNEQNIPNQQDSKYYKNVKLR